MAQRVAVVFVHGIRTSSARYSQPMRKRLLSKLPKEHQELLTFREVFWADLLRGRQDDYVVNAEASSLFKETTFRSFVIQGFGDAAAYQKTRSHAHSAYYQIQDRISKALKDLDNPDYPDRPLVFIGHSLGCHIISTYAWDNNRLKQMTSDDMSQETDTGVVQLATELRSKSTSPFRRLDTFAGFVTMGSNMPLFTFTIGPQNMFPISKSPIANKPPAFPGCKLKGQTLETARWLNFYSRNDLLGYPLKPLNEYYRDESRLSDIPVRAEGLFRSIWLRPLNALAAHTGYWTNRRDITDTARLLSDIIEAE